MKCKYKNITVCCSFYLRNIKNNNNFMKEQQFSYTTKMDKENRNIVILGKIKI